MIENCLGVRKARQIYRFFHQSKVTFLCFLLTILVLRGTIGAGKFGTPEQDFIHLRNRFTSRKLSQPLTQINPYFQSRVIDWDTKRKQWLDENPQFPNMIGLAKKKKKPRVLLVTGSSSNPCQNPVVDHYLFKSIKNKIDYCALHGIEVFYDMALLDAEMLGFWAKLPLIRALLLSHPEIELLWWMDSDVVFTDMVSEVPLEKYEGFNMVMHGWSEMVFEQKNWIGLNTGSFLIRNCQSSFDILDIWDAMGSKGKVKVKVEAGKNITREVNESWDFEGNDPSAIVYLLAKEKEKWGEKVYLENSYYLHGYLEILINNYKRPLVTHFVGCKPCGKISDYPVERCVKQMERAFNFGDNQMHGFAHMSLSSSIVKRIHNKTVIQRE